MNPASRSVATDRPSPSATARSNRFGDLALGSALLWLCPLCSASNGGRSLLSGLSRVRRKGGTRSQPDSGPCPLWPHRPPALSQGNSSRGAEDGRGAPASAFGQAGMEVVLLRGRGTREGRDPRRGWDWDRSNFVPLCPSVLGRWSWQRVGQARVPPRLLKQRLFTPFTILHSTYYSILFQPRQEGIENSRTRHRFHDRCDGDGGIGLRADDDAPTDDSVPGTVGLPLQLHRTQRRIEFTARGCSGRSPPITLELWPHHKWRSPARHKCMTGPLWRRPAATGLPACCCPCSVSSFPPRRSCYQTEFRALLISIMPTPAKPAGRHVGSTTLSIPPKTQAALAAHPQIGWLVGGW